MEETIEVRELIETVWKGKWIISVLTATTMLLAAVISWFILPEEYESKATVQVSSNVEDTEIISSFVATEFTPLIFSQRIKDEVNMNHALKEIGEAESFQPENLSANMQQNTNLIDITYKSINAEKAHDHLELFINKTIEQMNASVKITLQDLEKTYTYESNQLSAEIETLVGKYNNLIVSNKLPEILIIQTMMSSQVITSLSDAQTEEISIVDGSLHNELMQMQAQIASKSAEYRKVLDRYQSVKTGLDSFNPDPFIRMIIEPTMPENPTAPNKMLNVAIAMVIGLMAGLGIVFFREYWKNTKPTK